MIVKTHLNENLAMAFRERLKSGGYKSAEMTRIAIRQFLGIDNEAKQ